MLHLAVAFYNLFWDPFSGQNGLSNLTWSSNPHLQETCRDQGLELEIEDIHLCHSRWCRTVCVFINMQPKIPQFGATRASVTWVQWKDLPRTFSLFKKLWRLLWAWFVAGVFSSTCALWKPVAMSCSHYPEGRIGKLQCNLQPFCRSRTATRLLLLWKNWLEDGKTSPLDLNHFCSLRKWGPFGKAMTDYKMYRKIF